VDLASRGWTHVGIASKVMSRVPARLLIPSIAWQYRFFEPELARLAEFVPADRGAVDAGVWWGPWSWWLARRAVRVDSFEPNADLVSRIRPVMPRNVTIHQVALSDQAGEADLWVPAGGMGTEGRASLEISGRPSSNRLRQSVATKRLDDFDLVDVGFVKIDVEGHELAVLKGAVTLLQEQRPNVLIEIEHHADRIGPLDTIIEFFDDLSYSGEFLHKGQWRPISELDRESVRQMANQVARHGYGTNFVLYARRYIHNFVFKPS
jgi:FkbM family methyltransferase